MNQKQIYIFIGPKGSGKSYLGNLIERELDIKNLNAENIFKSLQSSGITTEENIIKAYKRIEEEIDSHLITAGGITFETTGIADEFWALYNRLKKKYIVKLISVYAPENLCIERIKQRNNKEHIAVDEASIRQVYLLCCNLEYEANLRVFTVNLNAEKFVEEFKSLIDINDINKSS